MSYQVGAWGEGVWIFLSASPLASYPACLPAADPAPTPQLGSISSTQVALAKNVTGTALNILKKFLRVSLSRSVLKPYPPTLNLTGKFVPGLVRSRDDFILYLESYTLNPSSLGRPATTSRQKNLHPEPRLIRQACRCQQA